MSFPVLADGAARDEAWWRQAAAFYPAPPDAIVNLEHGYFGAMAAPVQAAFEQAVRYTNEQLSPFVRGEFTRTHVDIVRQRLAAAAVVAGGAGEWPAVAGARVDCAGARTRHRCRAR